MKAVIYEKYGPPEVLHMAEVPTPVPKDNEVRVKIHATTVTSGDLRLRAFDIPPLFWLPARLFFGLSGPRHGILGCEFAGEIDCVGKDVTQFKLGDEVFGLTGARFGAYAQYKTVAEDGTLTRKPSNMAVDEAAAIPFGGIAALLFFRWGKMQEGDRVLINGASGAIGTAAVQLAKHFGAEVTGVCSAANLEMVQSIGADRVIDYTKEDFTESGETYDIIVDTVGTAPYSRSRNVLKEDGRLLLIYAGAADLFRAPFVRMATKRKIIAGAAAPVHAEDLRFLAQLAEAGVFKPVIDRTYSLDQMVEAHRYVDTGRKKGNVVITIDHDTPAAATAAPAI